MKSSSAIMLMAIFAAAAQALPVLVEQQWQALKTDLKAWTQHAGQSRSMTEINHEKATSPATLNLASLYEKKPRDLLPIGEGAYQDPKAVQQRTKDPDRACEHGDEAGCYQANGADLVDGHTYGHLRAPPAKSSATRGTTTLAAVVAATIVLAGFRAVAL
mmetsp:Transcript_17153/g.25893  ORF Transcript_17153/g.25893 Transcript_17153/m.25893 type:complete len:160 (-) Transcript_17153:90-569(-)